MDETEIFTYELTNELTVLKCIVDAGLSNDIPKGPKSFAWFTIPSGFVEGGYTLDPVFPASVVTTIEAISIFLIALFTKSEIYRFPLKSVLISRGPLNWAFCHWF